VKTDYHDEGDKADVRGIANAEDGGLNVHRVVSREHRTSPPECEAGYGGRAGWLAGRMEDGMTEGREGEGKIISHGIPNKRKKT
jgi:hypothetical protein